ncbi:hypothetical protein C2E23DRAFT_889853 [Lenzites betulinus]|nr:hypothetical protein C2E23DRAFT_889853 [Lenzites betulinus]
MHLALLLAHLLTTTTSAAPSDNNPDHNKPSPRIVDLVYSPTLSSVYGSVYITRVDNAHKTAVTFADQQHFFTFRTQNTTIPLTPIPESDRTLARFDNVVTYYETIIALNLA